MPSVDLFFEYWLVLGSLVGAIGILFAIRERRQARRQVRRS